MSASSIPRPVLIALVGGVLLVAAFFLLNKKSGDDEASVPPPPPPAATKPDTSKSADAGSKSKSGDKSPAADAGSQSKPDSSKSQTQAGTATGTGTGAETKEAVETAVQITKLPQHVQRALKTHKIVTVLFWRKQGVEDRYMSRALSDIRKCFQGEHFDTFICNEAVNRVKLFDPGVKALPRWLRITGVNGVALTPTYIVINRNGRADVQTGLVDGETMANVIYNSWLDMKRQNKAAKAKAKNKNAKDGK